MSRDRGRLQNAHENLTNQNSLLKIPQLVAPLRDNTDGVLDECHDDQEAADRGQMGLQGLRVYFYVVLDLFPELANFFERVVWVCSTEA